MIPKDQMIPFLLETMPEFQPQWDSFVSEWSDSTECPESGLPLYIVLCDLAEYLIELLEIGDLARLQKAFTVVEAWHVEGDSYVKEAASAGLLESIQNPYLHKTTSPLQFEPFLGPASRINWVNLYSFWKDKPNGL